MSIRSRASGNWRGLALCAAVLAAGTAGQAQQGDPPPSGISLSEAVDEAVLANPETRRAREQVEEFRLLVREVRADALPQFDFSFSAFRFRDPGLRNSPFFARLGEEGGDTGGSEIPPEAFAPFSFDNFEYRFGLEQPIYTFGRVSHALSAARDELQGVKTDVVSIERRIARDVAAAYYDLALAHDRARVLGEERASRERQLQQVKDRYELEDATRLDLLRAQVAISNLTPRLLAAENLVRVTRARLNETLGRPADSPVEPSEGLELPAPRPTLPSLEALLARADEGRPELRRFDLSRSVLREVEGVTRSETLPEIVANANYGISSFDISNLTDSSFRNWNVGVTLRWKLFDGFRTSSAVGRLRSQSRQSELQELSFRSQLARELEQASGDWEQGLAAVDAAELGVTQSKEAARIAEESYRWGAATLLEVLEAERDVREAELNRALARHAALTAMAQIKYLVGLSANAPTSSLAAAAPSEEQGE